MRVLAIGDIHGCDVALKTLFEQVRPQPEDKVIFLGDSLKPHKSGKRIICGHTTQPSGKINDVGFATRIDTAPATGGWLTCLDVDSGKFWQANQNGCKRAGILSQEGR